MFSETNEPLESSFIYSLGDRLCWPPTKITTEPVRDPYQYCFLKQNPNEDSDAATLIKIGVNVYSRDLFVSTSESKIRRVNLANISDVTNIVYGIDNLGGKHDKFLYDIDNLGDEHDNFVYGTGNLGDKINIDIPYPLKQVLQWIGYPTTYSGQREI